MDTADVDPTAQPTERRCTAHLFEESYLQDPIAYHGSSGSFTIPDIPKHPPAILFDAVYAGAVLEYFGTGEFKDHLAATWNNTLCPDGVTSAAQADQQKLDDGRAIAAERSAAQDQERTTRADNRDNRLRPDPIDMIMAVSYSMMPPAKLQARIEDARVKAEAAERRHAHEKVDAWMRQVTDA
ncbi:hypothetical protein FIBSPDRAFT_865634 [Athelia psychrophila]|uniref:Uncharacterized protein n=1 Tax=Athelia psychrophila TaxID=1759441 RepID=A0A166FD04_9AGAM|nr:hypothetical protein FIBSPDRAFT_865634 [Fibularhizoctonia sp. CBS 109695]